VALLLFSQQRCHFDHRLIGERWEDYGRLHAGVAQAGLIQYGRLGLAHHRRSSGFYHPVMVSTPVLATVVTSAGAQ
jgi:hypothetical protein